MAVGFEFAIVWKIFKDHKIEDSNVNSRMYKLQKAAVLYDAPSGWQMTADGDEIEFIVDQIEADQRGEGSVRSRLRALIQFIDTITNGKLAPQKQYLRNADLSKTLVKSSTKFVINTADTFQLTANPQASAGIRLGRIRKLFRILSDPNSNAAKQFIGEPDEVRKFISRQYGYICINHTQIRDSGWKALRPSPNLRGLATLIAFYIQQGKGKGGVGAVKYLFWVMCRTSFAALFKLIEPEEREYYQADPERWVSFICNDIMQKVPETGRVNPGRPLIERTITEQDPTSVFKKVRVNIPITIGDWLVTMIEGADLLSAAAHPIKGKSATKQNQKLYTDSRGYGHRLRGVAGLGDKMDNVTYRGRVEKAPVFEFRYRQRFIPCGEWPAYGIEIYRFIDRLNTGNRQAALDLGFTM
ncbi:MAG: hypothetical protein MI863_23455 [Desulfobacterales bacterium]|nr:hypothetical protein [Desulfobacterales bacterium]